jgi:hypothetical protein
LERGGSGVITLDELNRIKVRCRLHESFSWEEVELLLELVDELESRVNAAFQMGFSPTEEA